MQSLNAESILFASKKFLKTRETFYIFPDMKGFALLVNATVELYEAFDPEGQKSRGVLIAFALWRRALTAVSDVSRYWRYWNRWLR